MLIGGCEEEGSFVDDGFLNVVGILAVDLADEHEGFPLKGVD